MLCNSCIFRTSNICLFQKFVHGACWDLCKGKWYQGILESLKQKDIPINFRKDTNHTIPSIVLPPTIITSRSDK